MMIKKPIVVLTPVKNEDWILERFLTITSCFADSIIVADQFSSDNTRDIAKKFPKVVLIDNNSLEYDEEYRQKLLISKAREIYPEQRILLALDADEIMTADSLSSNDWDEIQCQPEGTLLKFEKPDLLCPLNKCLRRKEYFTLGYVDDGIEHTGSKIHSTRVPKTSSQKSKEFSGIKFMHYALTRPLEYIARQRLYSTIENIKKTNKLHVRLIKYSPRLNDIKFDRFNEPTPESWFKGWETLGIDVKNVTSNENNIYNIEALKNLHRFGSKKFFYEDIWDFDWGKFQKTQSGSQLVPKLIKPSWYNRTLLLLLICLLKIKKSFFF